jgi:hypothetical protein
LRYFIAKLKVMQLLKNISFLLFSFFILNNCISQSKAQIKKKPIDDSVLLAKNIQKLTKTLVKKEMLESFQKNDPLKTLTIIYGEQIILTTAKND